VSSSRRISLFQFSRLALPGPDGAIKQLIREPFRRNLTMAVTILIIAIWFFGIVSLFRKPWAFAAFMILSVLYFPAKVGFALRPRACEFAFDIPLAVYSLNNYAHIILFAVFFLVASFQFRMGKLSSFLKAGLLTMLMGVLVELGEGISGRGNCRLRDLIPDLAGALLGALVALAFLKVRLKYRSN